MKDSTKKTYEYNLERIRKLTNTEDLNKINVTQFDKLIKEYSTNTKKMFYKTLLKVNQSDEVYQKFREYATKVDDDLKKSVSTKKLCDWSKLAIVVDKIEETGYKGLIYKLIAHLYFTIPPLRRDYCDLKVIGIKKDVNDTDNFYVKKTGTVILNDYKNVDNFGKYEFKLPKQIKKIIDELLPLNKSGYLIPQIRDNEKVLSKDQLGQIINYISEKYLGNKYSINDLRKIYETTLISSPEYQKMSFAEKEKKHAELLHTFMTAQKNYYKINADGKC